MIQSHNQIRVAAIRHAADELDGVLTETGKAFKALGKAWVETAESLKKMREEMRRTPLPGSIKIAGYDDPEAP